MPSIKYYAQRLHVPEIALWLNCICLKIVLCPKISLLHVPKLYCARRFYALELHRSQITLCPKIACAQILHYRRCLRIALCPRLHCARRLHVPAIALCPRLHCALKIACAKDCIIACARDCILSEVCTYPNCIMPKIACAQDTLCSIIAWAQIYLDRVCYWFKITSK